MPYRLTLYDKRKAHPTPTTVPFETAEKREAFITRCLDTIPLCTFDRRSLTVTVERPPKVEPDVRRRFSLVKP